MSLPTYRLVETAAPAAEPLSLAEAKLHLRVDHDAEDDLIAALIAAARALCENATGLALITRSYSLYLDRWPGAAACGWWDGLREGADTATCATEIVLPKPPLAAVAAINIFDAEDQPAAFAASGYYADTIGMPGRIVLKAGVSAPIPGRVANGVEIQFTAGYGAAAEDVPAVLRQGMKQIIAHLYSHRGDDPEAALMASGAQALFQPFRAMRLA